MTAKTDYCVAGDSARGVHVDMLIVVVAASSAGAPAVWGVRFRVDHTDRCVRVHRLDQRTTVGQWKVEMDGHESHIKVKVREGGGGGEMHKTSKCKRADASFFLKIHFKVRAQA